MMRFWLVLFLFTYAGIIYSQEAIKPRPSPTAIVTMKFEDSYVKITYCQPHKNGREVFGNLVPFGEVWRTGANEATEITVSQDIMFGGNMLSAGTYSIFTIPDKSEWTIILNSGLGQWGSYSYNEELEIFRFNVKSGSTGGVVWEPFTIAFEQANDKADLVMMWEETKIRIPIAFIPVEN